MASFRIHSGGNYCSMHTYRDAPNPSNRRTSVAIPRSRSRTIEIPHLAVKSKSHRRISHETIEEWIHESATEIVKNLSNAPLLIQVIEDADGRKRRLEVEKAASAEKWRKRKDAIGVAKGVIVVEELKNGDVEDENKVWGMVVQGRGLDCGPVCYLLKTSRIRSSLGCGCTHFCLVRVKDFDRTAEHQLADVWLC